jgi:SAM-dependent methyltransferase
MTAQLGKDFWNDRYRDDQTGWDLGMVSPPLKFWIDTILDKNLRILIPGAGNAYEVDELIQQGFTSITVIDIAPIVMERLKDRYKNYPQVKLVLGDFFELTASFDVVLEQTFFCAIDPSLRSAYVNKMAEIIVPDGQLLGVLFDRSFEGGPPFGGSASEYQSLFSPHFDVKISPCNYSHPAREGSEVLIQAKRLKV